MKKYTILLAVFMVINIGFFSITTNNSNATHSIDNKISKNFVIQNIKYDNITFGPNPYAIIETSLGTIKIELFKDLVPNTVDNFINLTKIGFYNGLVFHRVIDDFVMQGGGYYPNGTHKESPYDPIDLEIHPKARHVNGAIGMARTSDPNSATSQFYICDGPQHSLDDEYAVFGKVTLGTISVVREIASVETMTKYGMKDWPVDDVIINSLIIKAKSKEVNTPLLDIQEDNPNLFSYLYFLQNFLMGHPNMFPILQMLFHRLGLQ